ncbi:molybdenum cofactor guanylyltransferase [Psychrosphaera sp. B3R10]|uniref:molybdenum cofactor guanylyltransferase n=1 Tax=unclassified Psychrosphaera TaxID=2641570 RepID=UPI001C094F26|nr:MULTISPECIES: molybdenum cofactor guanylyltransferase [unclassified Psychrosphaera]MBU2882025.1 molybdenum cofactor guanylyltransferase [Psychrosphaera sp. I2R16]MBU2989844.1 molybdenum cofactor guanylyltransferase [Psychrosphaera sp. B3R10]
MSHSEFIGVVMSGGKSQRMGTNKALLERHGKTMADFTAECLTTAGARQVLHSVPFGFETVASNQIADITSSLGPLGGILSILDYAINQDIKTNFLFVPVDLPLLKPQTLTQLAQYSLINENAVTFHRQPLPVLIRPSLDILKTLIEITDTQKNLSMFHFLDKINAEAIKLEDVDVLYNSNRPEEWQAALAKLKS